MYKNIWNEKTAFRLDARLPLLIFNVYVSISFCALDKNHSLNFLASAKSESGRQSQQDAVG